MNNGIFINTYTIMCVISYSKRNCESDNSICIFSSIVNILVIYMWLLRREEMEFRKNYEPSVDEDIITFTLPSLTQQSQAEFADINNIMAKYQKTGLYVGFSNNKEPEYGDFSIDFDYREALDKVIEAQEQFESLPAAIRRRFHDDPEEFYEFCGDPANREEMIKLGLIDKVEGVGTDTLLDVTVPTDTNGENTTVVE